MEAERMALVVTVEDDVVYGDMDWLSKMLVNEGWEIWVEVSLLTVAVDMKKQLVLRACLDENANPREVVVEDLNTTGKQLVMTSTELVMELGRGGWVPWDTNLDSSFNRWVLQDIHDKVRCFWTL